MKLNLIILFSFLTIGLKAQTNVKIILATNKQVDSVMMTDVSQKEIYKLKYSDTLNFNFKKITLIGIISNILQMENTVVSRCG
jgi:hypothetical protein